METLTESERLQRIEQQLLEIAKCQNSINAWLSKLSNVTYDIESYVLRLLGEDPDQD